MAIWKLTIEDDEGHQTVVPLVRDGYTVGRREGHPIRLTERNVSRDHARLRKDEDGAYLLEDLGSYNGVFVNGHRLVEPKKLQPGDLVILGDYRIEAHSDEAPVRLAPSIPPKPSAPPVALRSDRPAPPTSAPTPATPDRLVLLGTADAGREFALEGKKIILGRGDEVEFRVNHSSVSRQHCEFGPTDDGRWEIKDLGSANGLKINGTETRRGVVKAGDTIELGDVPIKFVGAGQPFLFDAAMAEVARDGAAKKKGGATTWVIVAGLVVAAAVGGVLLASSTNRNPTVANSTTSTANAASASPDEAVIIAAKSLREAGQLTSAHDKLTEIAVDSKARTDARYVDIENAWCDTLARNASTGTDDVRQDAWSWIDKSGADSVHKDYAKKTLFPSGTAPSTTTTTEPTTTTTATIDAGRAAPSNTTTATATATVTASTTQAPTATTTAPPLTTTATTAPTTTTPPKPTATTPPAGGCAAFKGDYMAAFKARDYACVRSILLPLLNAGSISAGQARVLKAACNSLGDVSCQTRAAEKM
jgi:pSer/pThr/pTyr-binding forkhead associated (FHA) protein